MDQTKIMQAMLFKLQKKIGELELALSEAEVKSDFLIMENSELRSKLEKTEKPKEKEGKKTK